MNKSLNPRRMRNYCTVALSACLLPATLNVPAGLPVQPEQIVVTHFSGVIAYYSFPPTATPNLGTNGYVVAKFDTQTGNIGPLIPPTSSPPGLWDPGDAPPFSSFHNETGQPWNSQRLGEVFGITVDDASPPNIYVTATEAYNIVGSATPLPKGPGGPGGIYRLNGTTGASSFGSLPNNSVNGPGLGNVCFRRAGSGIGYLYVSDLEDGMIYRVNAATLTPVGAPFDHGVQGRPNLSLAPIVDDGTPGLTQFGRRIWGVKTYQNKLYYAVWWEDSRNVSLTESNEIWTVNLDNNGDFIPATAQRIISIPNFATFQWSHPIASIDFSPNGKMFLAERYWQYLGMIMNSTFGAHHTRILRYWLSGPTWVTDPSPTHQVGGDPTVFFGVNMPGANSAGGVAVNCDESVWVTGDMYAGSYSSPPNMPFGPGDLGYVYGALRIPTGGNSMYAGLGYGSFAIDYDMNTNTISKFGVGAIATVRSCCVPPPTGLVAWWPLDELTGATTYADLSGSGNTALIESGGPLGSFQSPGWTAGKVAGASSFLNSLSRGRALNSTSLNFGTNSFSLDCWVRPVQASPAWQTIVDKLNTSTARGYTVGISNGNLTLLVGDGALYTHTGPAVNPNVWNFVGVAVNRSTSKVQFFLNGVPAPLQTLLATGNLNNNLDLLIGAPYAPNVVSETSLDEIELFNRALATNEFTDIWMADSIGKCKSGQPPCTNGIVTMVCPTNMTQACAPVVHYPPPQASTTCGTITNIVCAPPSGSTFPVGPSVVTCTAINSVGNSNSCAFTITVAPDTTPPTLDCNCLNYSAHEALNIQGCNGVVPDLCNYLSFQCAYDDCCLDSCSQSPAPGTPVGPGATPITFIISDCAGNTNSCVLILTVSPPPEGCGTPCTNKMAFLSLVTNATSGIFSGANGTIVAQTAGGPFMSLNNTPYNSKFPNLFPASGIVTGYLAQVDLNGSLAATFYLSNYTITPGTMFGIWNITEEPNTYQISVYDCASNLIAPPFPAGSFSFIGWDDDALSGNIGWYHMSLTPATGFLNTTNFAASGTDCDAAFWTNIPPAACRIVVSRSKGDADGVVFYFGETQPCCQITCQSNITVTTCSNSAAVTFPTPVSSNCPPGSAVICNPSSGYNFPLGTNTVVCTVIDAIGTPLAACHFSVIVLPKTPTWSVTCPNPTTSINVTGCPPLMPNLSNYITITTNCPTGCPITVNQSIPPGTPLSAGTYVAIVNICQCQTNCKVCDVTIKAYASGGNPTIKCPPNQVIVTCATNAIGYYKVKATGFTGPIVCTPPSGYLFPLGTTIVTCTVTNACGGIATCSFTVTVKRPPFRWLCDWQAGIGIPYTPVGGATTALRAVGPGDPAICVFANPANPTSGALLHLGQAQVVTFTTELDFTAPFGSGIDFVLPPGPSNTNGLALLSFRNKGAKGYCVKVNKRFADDPTGLFRTTAVNTNGQLLDAFNFNWNEAQTNDNLIIGFQPGVTNCHVTAEIDCYSGVISVEFSGPVSFSSSRKGWDGCIYGPDRPVKKPTSKVYFVPPVTPGETPITDLNMFPQGLSEAGLEEPSITAAGRKWGDGHVTLMKAYDDGQSMEFTVLSSQGEPVHLDLGHVHSFDLHLTRFTTNPIPGEELLTRTTGSISGLPTLPDFLDQLLLKESGGQVECSADLSNFGSPTVRVEVWNNHVLVAGRTDVPAVIGQALLTLPTWPDRLGKLGGASPCRRGTLPAPGLIMLPGTTAGEPPLMVDGDEFRIIAELPPGSSPPDYYTGFDFIGTEGGNWGVSQLTSVTACVPAPIVITRSSGAVTVTWSDQKLRLQGAASISGPWFDLGADSPAQFPATSTARFFRLICN